ncbi:YceI family protein [Nocardiaceae bacterium YC2-7]|uniref:YceI family protein n=2 Tax=Antrihabitans stalactiti TaxID=2584121 RepID=A0A848KJA9_9NOCA|nr:YceI family protein [Antrihabitans stalactiti]
MTLIRPGRFEPTLASHRMNDSLGEPMTTNAISSNRQNTLAGGLWMVDTAHSSATFTVRKLGFIVKGSVPIGSGQISIGPDGYAERAAGTIELSAIDTGNKRRDKDLRKPNFLDLDNYPMMTFVARDIVRTESGLQVAGEAQVRGQQVPLEFDVSVDGDRMIATATLDRCAFGLKVPRFLIGRYVSVTVEAVVRRADR